MRISVMLRGVGVLGTVRERRSGDGERYGTDWDGLRGEIEGLEKPSICTRNFEHMNVIGRSYSGVMPLKWRPTGSDHHG